MLHRQLQCWYPSSWVRAAPKPSKKNVRSIGWLGLGVQHCRLSMSSMESHQIIWTLALETQNQLWTRATLHPTNPRFQDEHSFWGDWSRSALTQLHGYQTSSCLCMWVSTELSLMLGPARNFNCESDSTLLWEQKMDVWVPEISTSIGPLERSRVS